MLPGVYDLHLYRGDTSRLRFVLWQDEAKTLPVDLSGAAVAAQIRDTADATTIVATFTCAVTLPQTIDIVLAATDAAALHVRGNWDLQITYPGSDVQTVLAGKVSVVSDVTRLAAE